MKFLILIKSRIYFFLIDHYPRIIIDRIWKREVGYTVNWKSPRDINEKMEWLVCYGDTSKWTDLADKYKVGNYVQEKGYGHLLTKLYGVWEHAEQIDYDALPEKFVLKCNHDCGSYHLIDKSLPFDKAAINKDLDNHVNSLYGYRYCEPHYNQIHPLIIAEEMLEDKSFPSLVDYKVWCFDGVPYCVITYYNRTKEHVCFMVHDLDWNEHPEYGIYGDHFMEGKGVPRPKLLDEMLQAASDLSKGFPQVRVDFYVTNDQLHFGEMTFVSNAGRMRNFTQEYLEEMGRQCVLS